MENLFERAWDIQDRVLLVGYDTKLGNSIGLKGLLPRIGPHISLPDPNLLAIEKGNLNTIAQELEDLRGLWKTQAEFYEFERSPDLVIFGEILGHTNNKRVSSILYALGSSIKVNRRNNLINPLTKLKAVEGSKTVTPFAVIEENEFDFNAFLRNR